MTHDESTTSNDETINEEKQKRDALLRRYQRGIRLLDHPHFLLLYVPDDGNKMRLVKPASDSYHRERIIQMLDENEDRLLPHYALSHLWGTSKANRHLWEEIGDYVDDENGEPAEPVSMRTEKRNTLLTLLNDHPDSYWWIDVLCARSDTPLGIMGDIYACCYLCYAMVDCEPELISRIKSMSRKVRGSPETLLSRWTKDIHKEVHQLILETFYECSWWKRVWTWQEAVLPVEVLFIPETLTELSDSDMLSINDVKELTDEGSFAYLKRGAEAPSDYGGIEGMMFIMSTTLEISRSRSYCHRHITPSVLDIDFLFRAFAESPRQCMDPVDYVYGVLGIFQIDIPRKTDPNEVWQLFVTELLKLLTDPKRVRIQEDYVKQMISKYKSDRVRQCNLLTAKNMGEIYRCLKR